MKASTKIQKVTSIYEQWEETFTQTALEPKQAGRQRIGILGGTFNPPHLGHLIMAEQAGYQLELDEVWFMPTASPPHAQGKTTIDSKHRVAMTRLAIQDNERFKIQTYEVDRGGKNYTVETMRHFVSLYPDIDFYFIIGGDSANDLPMWYKADEIAQLVYLVGVNRPGSKPYPHHYPILWIDSPLIDISSSQIRWLVFLEQSIRYQVPRAVEEYIKEHQLY